MSIAFVLVFVCCEGRLRAKCSRNLFVLFKTPPKRFKSVVSNVKNVQEKAKFSNSCLFFEKCALEEVKNK